MTAPITSEYHNSQDPTYQKSHLYYVLPGDVFDSNELCWEEKALYMLLSALAHKDGTCFPSNPYLVERMRVSEKTLKNWLKKLEDLKYISRTHQSCPSNPFRHFRTITLLPPASRVKVTPPAGVDFTPPIVSEVSIVSEVYVSNAGAREKDVHLSEEEHQKLIQEHGSEKVQRFYKRLSEWKQDTPKSKWKKSDYRSILRWVIVAEEKAEADRLGVVKWPARTNKSYQTRSNDCNPTSWDKGMQERHLAQLTSVEDMLKQ